MERIAKRETLSITKWLQTVADCGYLIRETHSIANRETEGKVARKVWTEQEIRDLGVTTDAKTAFSILGVGQVKGYEMVRQESFPAQVLRIGPRIVVPVAGLLKALGIEDATAAA